MLPLPAHQTGRAGFPHPAFRLASSHGTRRRANMDTPEVEHPQRAEDRFAVEAVGAARRHVMTPHQKVTHAFVDVIVDRAVCGHSGAVAEVGGRNRATGGSADLALLAMLRCCPAPGDR